MTVTPWRMPAHLVMQAYPQCSEGYTGGQEVCGIMQDRRFQRPSGPPSQAGALAALHGFPPPCTGDKSSLFSLSV